MGVYKFQLSFFGGGSLGRAWSEVYYGNFSALAAAVADITGRQQYRLYALNSKFTLQKIRVSDTNQSRVSVVIPVNIAGQFNVAGNPQNPGDPDTAAVYTLSSGVGGASRKVWFRGLEDEQVYFDKTADTWIIYDQLKHALDTWVSQLALGGYIIYRHSPASNLFPDMPVVTATPVANSNVTTFSTLVNHNFFPGTTIRMHAFSAKDLPGLNGTWQVIAPVTQTTFTLPYTLPRLEAQTAVSGKVRLWQVDNTNVIFPSTSGFSYVGSRKTRSPFTGGRGSRRSPLRGKRLSP